MTNERDETLSVAAQMDLETVRAAIYRLTQPASERAAVHRGILRVLSGESFCDEEVA